MTRTVIEFAVLLVLAGLAWKFVVDCFVDWLTAREQRAQERELA